MPTDSDNATRGHWRVLRYWTAKHTQHGTHEMHSYLWLQDHQCKSMQASNTLCVFAVSRCSGMKNGTGTQGCSATMPVLCFRPTPH